MGDFTGSTTVDVSPSVLFDYLSEVGNLPDYFARMTSAERGDGEEVHTTARMPDGQEVEGDAWFRVDDDAQRIEWGSEGPNDYNGYVDVRPSGDGSEVEVHVHTTRVDDGSSEVEEGIRETLSKLKQRAEQVR
ncbi:MAG TPA: SRPBCC family protein [Lapillicoccus sp.]